MVGCGVWVGSRDDPGTEELRTEVYILRVSTRDLINRYLRPLETDWALGGKYTIDVELCQDRYDAHLSQVS